MQSNPAALRQLREAKGHTQASLARASGVSQQRISELEAGRKLTVTPPIALKLAKALDVPLSVIARSDEPEQAEVAL